MVVCQYFQKGNCRFGDSCRNEHPRNQPAQNRFAPLQNPAGGRGRSGAFGQTTQKNDEFGVDTDIIKADLTHINNNGDRPEWPLSAYAPGRNPPRQLIEGPLEISPEEMRVQCYLARVSGKGDEYINQENALLKQSQQQVQTILNDLQAAKNYVLEGVNQHPNRLDMEVKPTQNFPWVNKPGLAQQSQTGGFGQTSAFGGGGTSSGGFGQPSTLGGSKPAFGAASTTQGSAFGQSTPLGGASAFGQTSALGGAGGFGQASKLGGGATFGQASTPAAKSPFGGAQKPAAFGQASTPASGFGSSPAFGQSGFGSAAAKPAFGAPTQPTSTFGQPAQTTSTAFGQPSQPSGFGAAQTGGSAFGQPSAFGAKPSPFAAAAQNGQQQGQPATGSTAFGQPSAFGANKPSPFAASAQTSQQGASPFAQQGATFGTSGFGAASKPASSSPFAAQNQTTTPSAFGAPSQPAAQSGFGATSNTTGGFGTASNTTTAGGFGTSSNNTTGGFGTSTNPTPFGTQPQQAPRGPRTIPQTWKGHKVLQEGSLTYYEIPANNPKDPSQMKRIRIWFPTGAPDPKGTEFAEAPPEKYEGQLGETLRSLYEFVATQGAFKEGVMPEIPPKREWISWEF